MSFTAPDEWTLAVVYDNADADAETDADADEWLSVSSENGPAGEQTVELVADPKITEESRTAYVDIACGEETVRLTVTQTGASDETDFTTLFDPDFAKKLEEQEIIPNAQKITRDDMKKIADVTELDVSFEALTSLQGIEYFESLTILQCLRNSLTSLDISKNTALTTLGCAYNSLTSLDISKNTALEAMDCGYNPLTSLDVSQNTALTQLNCYSNQLTALNVSQNTELTQLWCNSNQLTSLDVSKNTGLTKLNCYSNQLTALNVSKNTKLTMLLCYSNQLTTLNISQNTELERLNCRSNQLTALDVSKNTKLTALTCYSNQLKSLDVSQNTKLGELDCKDNPGDGSIFPVTVWDDFDPDNISSDFTTGNWIYEDNTITVQYKKAE